MKVIILAGGGGARLYPLSTEERPKQFVHFTGHSLLQQAVLRYVNKVAASDIVIVTNNKYIQLTNEQLGEIGYENVKVIGEPSRRNTAVAVALGLNYFKVDLHINDKEMIFIGTADHVISPVSVFDEYLCLIQNHIKDGELVTMGIFPTCANTQYGYIEYDKLSTTKGLKKVRKFVEKPDKATAERYIQSGNFLWNSGMFAVKFKTILTLYQQHCKNIFNTIIEVSSKDALNNYQSCKAISFDYAIAENCDNIKVLPIQLDWIDLGSFSAIYDFFPKDNNGNVKLGKSELADVFNCLIINNDAKHLVISNVKDLVIVNTKDVCFMQKLD